MTLATLAAATLLAAGCGELDQPGGGTADGSASATSPYLGTTVSDDPPQPGGRLVYGLPGETNSFNPTIAQWAAYSVQVTRAIYDALFLYDSEGNVQNNLVDRAEHNEDYTEWTVTLRSGVTFHNGKPLTAEAVTRGWKKVRDSGVIGSAYNLATIDRTEVVDDLSYKIVTRKPWPTMRQSGTQLAVVDPDWMDSADHAHPIGTGPFKVDSWEVGKTLVVTRNPSYWRTDAAGRKLPYLDRIDFVVVANDQDRANQLQEGKLDIMMQTLATPNIKSLRDQCRAGKLQCFSDEKVETPEDLVVLNTTKPPLNTIDARRALAHAIDRKDFAQQLSDGIYEPADSMYGPSSPWYTPSNYPAYDPAEAKRLVERVKMRNRGLFRFELLVPNTENGQRIGQYLRDAWKKVGVDATVVAHKNSDKIIFQLRGEYQASVTQLFESVHPAQITTFIDPTQTREGQMSLVFSRLNDPEMTARIEALLRGEPETGVWQAATARIIERVNTMVPFLWLDHAPRNFFARTDVVNITQSTLPDGRLAQDFHLGSHALSQIWIKRS